MPRAAPTSLVTSFIADPTPDFESGTEPTMSWLAAGISTANPIPMGMIRARDEPVGGVDVQCRQPCEPQGSHPAPDPYRGPHAEAADDLQPRGAMSTSVITYGS